MRELPNAVSSDLVQRLRDFPGNVLEGAPLCDEAPSTPEGGRPFKSWEQCDHGDPPKTSRLRNYCGQCCAEYDLERERTLRARAEHNFTAALAGQERERRRADELQTRIDGLYAEAYANADRLSGACHQRDQLKARLDAIVAMAKRDVAGIHDWADLGQDLCALILDGDKP